MKRSFSIFCHEKSKEKNIERFLSQVKTNTTKVPTLILFSSDSDNFSFYSTILHNLFPSAQIIGSTSYVMFCDDGNDYSGLSVFCVTEGVECVSGVIENIKRNPMKFKNVIQDAVDSLSEKTNTCCFEVTTAFSNSEELVLDTFESVLGKNYIPLLGTSAGGNYENPKTMVSLNGKVFDEACVFVLIHNLKGKITLYKENLYKPMNQFFTATDVDCDKRIVYEYDSSPAADFLSNKYDIPKNKLFDFLKEHPLGKIFGDEVHITEIDKINENGSIAYFSKIFKMTKLSLLEQGDMYKEWRQTTLAVKSKVPEPSFNIIVNCCSRISFYSSKNELDSFFNLLKNEYGTYIGFSGFGEQFNYTHLNQTMVLAAFE